MDTLRKIFPFAFKEKKDVSSLIIHILIHYAVCFAVMFVLGFSTLIPIIGLIFGPLLIALAGIYNFVSVLLCILHYCKKV